MKTTRRLTHLISILILTLTLMLAVSVHASAASISRKTLTLTAGSTACLKVSGAKKVSWKSSKKSIATVSKKGVVKAVRSGKVKITAKAGKKKMTCTVKVLNRKASANTAKNTSGSVSKNTSGSAPAAASASVSGGINLSTAGMRPEEIRVFGILLSFRSKYREGRRWTNDDYYGWNGGTFRGGYGCAAFAFLLSDAAFGTVRASIHSNISAIRPGDILRVDGNTHSVIVLRADKDSVTVAEGNYGSAIHWGRKITRSELKKTLDYVMTRYE